MRWFRTGSEWHWRFAIFPIAVDRGDSGTEYIWLEWYRVNVIGKVLLKGEVEQCR